jgi:inorganic triphosphatase YgiF
MAASIERELKLRAKDDEPLRVLATTQRLGRFALGPARVANELDRYLDTPDGRLAAGRWACRLRERDGAVRVSLKGPPEHGAADPLHRRPEVEGEADADAPPTEWPSSAARNQLLQLSGGEPLVERLVLRQERTERSVRGDSEVGTLSLDRVTVLHHGEPVGEMRVVELELLPGGSADTDTDELVRELLGVPGLALEPHTKLERALAILRDRT